MSTELSPEAGIALMLGGFLLFIIIISLPTWIHEWRERRHRRNSTGVGTHP